MTDQVRRSSRAVCGSLAEAWRKRRYPNHFISKLSDADGEAAETQNWLDFARSCGYLSQREHVALWEVYEQVTRGLVGMISHAETWCGPALLVRESVAEYLVAVEDDAP